MNSHTKFQFEMKLYIINIGWLEFKFNNKGNFIKEKCITHELF